ncbi:hypothetical protein [Sinomicrobium sp. M5D2P9]
MKRKSLNEFYISTGYSHRPYPGEISKADVAMFLLMQLHMDQYLKKTPGLSY